MKKDGWIKFWISVLIVVGGGLLNLIPCVLPFENHDFGLMITYITIVISAIIMLFGLVQMLLAIIMISKGQIDSYRKEKEFKKTKD